MGLIEMLKNKKEKVVELNNKSKMDNIKIVIENSCGAFKNEEELIKESALKFYEFGQADSYENAIIQAATIIRGLQYKETTKDENGNLVITFKDIVLDESKKI